MAETVWRRWLRRWTLLSVPGACLSVLTWSTSTLVAVALLPALVGGAVQVIASSPQRDGASRLARPRDCARTGLCAAVVVVSLGGLGSISVSAAVACVLVLGLTSPVVVRCVRPGATSTSDLTPAPVVRVEEHRPVPPSAALPEELGRMSEAQLCLAWRRSFVALQGTPTVEERTRLVALRQSYLDEIERRDAAALRAWLANGARAAGGPERYLADGDLHRPDAA